MLWKLLTWGDYPGLWEWALKTIHIPLKEGATHAAERLGLWATATEPARLEPVLRNKRGRDGERPAHGDEEWPPLAATREGPPTETKTQHSQK